MALKKNNTKQDLINLIGDQNIFEHYFGQEISLSKSYQSVFRVDNSSSTGFYIGENGYLIYNDFSTSEKLDCVAFVAKILNITYQEAITQIAIDFNLKTGKKSSDVEATIKKRKPLVKQEKVIKIAACKFTEAHLDYWKKYYVTEQELKENKVFAVCELNINGWTVPRNPTDISFGYLITDRKGKDYLKVYTPESKEFKWCSSAPNNLMFGLLDLPKLSNTLFICKSQKERIIVKKLFSDVVSLQLENSGSLDLKELANLRKEYKHIIYFGDNDTAGIKFIQEHMHKYVDKCYHFPPNFLTKFNIKDIADFCQFFGVNVLEQYFKHINILS
jgi:hypothetical protein